MWFPRFSIVLSKQKAIAMCGGGLGWDVNLGDFEVLESQNVFDGPYFKTITVEPDMFLAVSPAKAIDKAWDFVRQHKIIRTYRLGHGPYSGNDYRYYVLAYNPEKQWYQEIHGPDRYEEEFKNLKGPFYPDQPPKWFSKKTKVAESVIKSLEF